MFDLGAAELLVIVIVAVVVIGPKDLPMALRTAGNWIGKVRRVSSHFRTGLDTMIREAELDDMEKKWKAQNEAIMARTKSVSAEAGLDGDDAVGELNNEMTGPPAAKASSADDMPKPAAPTAPTKPKNTAADASRDDTQQG